MLKDKIPCLRNFDLDKVEKTGPLSEVREYSRGKLVVVVIDRKGKRKYFTYLKK